MPLYSKQLTAMNVVSEQHTYARSNLAITEFGTGAGTIKVSGALGRENPSGTFLWWIRSGETVSLLATPDSGSSFTSWAGSDAGDIDDTNAASTTMTLGTDSDDQGLAFQCTFTAD